MLTINYTAKEILADHNWDDGTDDIDLIKINKGEKGAENGTFNTVLNKMELISLSIMDVNHYQPLLSMG